METLQRLSEHFVQTGRRPALVDLAGQESARKNFDQLAEEIDAVAKGLLNAHLGHGERVAIVGDNSTAWIIVTLAVLRAGGVAVPIDAQFTAEQLSHILKLARPPRVFASQRVAERIAELNLDAAPRVIRLDDGPRPSEQSHWTELRLNGGFEAPEADANETAVIFFTSGTTGPAKGVPLSHRNLMHQLDVLARLELVTENDRLLLPLPLHHVYPFTIGLLAPLYLGVPVILPAGLTGSQLAAALAEEDVTFIIGLPRLYRTFYEGIENRVRKTGWTMRPLLRGLIAFSTWVRAHFKLRAGRFLLWPLHRRFAPQLTTLISGGAALPPELAMNLEGLGWRVGSGYGLTETSPLLTLIPPKAMEVEGAGRPVEGVDLRISTDRDEEGLGEVQVRGPNVFTSYLDQPEKTKEAFTEDGWFCTGDRGRIDQDRMVHLSGRLSTLIVTEAGENIQPDQVEEAYEQHPAIAEIGVLERDNRLVAVVVADPTARKGNDVREALSSAIGERARELPTYQRLAGFEVSREKLPRTRLGKVRRGKLEELFDQLESGKLEQEEGPIAIEDMDPADRQLLEDERVRSVWSMLAERFPHIRLTPNSSLSIDVGIDSLDWVELTFSIGDASGVDLDNDDVAEIETIRDLLTKISDKHPGAAGQSRADLFEHPESVLSDEDREWIAPRSPATRWLGALGYRLNRLIFRTFFKLDKSGIENIPQEGPVIITPNHMSYLDGPAVAAALDNDYLSQIRWAGYREIMMGNTIMRLVSRAAKVIPIDPSGGAGKSLAYGAQVLKNGEALVWFPEGALSRSGKLQQFQPGAAMLARRLDLPVVPVIISGSGEALPPDTLWPRRSKISVEFGTPLVAGDLPSKGGETEDWRTLNEVLHQQMEEMARRLGTYQGEPP